METTVTKLEPDVSRISESLRVLSEELPRISNLESTAILRALQELREDIRHHDNNTLLNDKLDRILESLGSLERRIGKLEQPRDKTSTKVEDREISDASQSNTTKSNGVKPKPGSPIQEPLSTTRVQGASGALLIILATVLPILFVVLYL